MVKLHCQSWIIYVFFVVVVVVDLFCYLAAKKRKELFVLGSLWEKMECGVVISNSSSMSLAILEKDE